MSRTDNLYVGADARAKLITGIKKVADAVGGTMGTGGANSIIEAIENPGHLVTNDGITIAQAVKLADPIEEIGRRILLESISRANKSSGDGSSTTCVLTSAIIQEGIQKMGVPPMDLKRSLEECVPIIEAALKDQTKEISVDEVGRVATISAEDEQIGNTIQEIYKQIGKEGIVYWDISKTGEDTYTIGKGITIEGAGIASPYMCDRDKESGQFLNSAKLQNPKIIITKEKLTTAGAFEAVFTTLNERGEKEVVIFCDDFDINIVAQFVATQQVRGFRTVMVKMPVLWKDEWYVDLAHATGATIIDPVAGRPLKSLKIEDVGTVGYITINKEDTFIDGVADLSSHIESLKAEGTDEANNRVARLNVKTARYFVGAHSDSALSYRRLKVEDAISAAWQALNGGIVAGGGIALRNVTRVLPSTIGGEILKKALQIPAIIIMENAGVTEVPPMADFEGIDSRTKTKVDMFEAGIIDPLNVVLNAVKNSVSVAAAILTANTVVALPREENTQNYGANALIR